MAAVTDPGLFGTRVHRPTAAQITAIRDLDNSPHSPVKSDMIAFPTPLNAISFELASVSADSSGYSVAWQIPHGMTLEAVDLGCTAAAGATGTMDLEVSTNGTDYSSVFLAAKDVKTGAGKTARYLPEADSGATTRTIAYTSTTYLRVKGTSGSGGALSGGKGIIYYRAL
jgi:hypothetical protein